jgi:AcrR family transcriptional regulator
VPVLSGRFAEARANDERIRAAAREALIELGADAPVSVIASRAGVGIGTLYRRYPTKEELIRQLCVDSMEFTLREAQDALAAPDAWSAFATFMRRCLDAGVGTLSHLAGSFTVPDEVWQLGERLRQAIQAVVDRAHVEGPLRPGITAADVCLVLRQLRTPHPAPSSPPSEHQYRYLALVLDGLCGDRPLPGEGASWREGELLWRTRNDEVAGS